MEDDTIPRLTLYKPTKTNDFNFMDRNIREQFSIGGTGVNVHKYIGPAAQPDKNDPSQPTYYDGREVDPITGEFTNTDGIINETNIQDLLFLENRDRKYDPDIYDMRGIYNVSDNDFDLTQFGLFNTGDQFYMTFHINEMVEIIGRKLLAGDVLELPHLRDDLLLDASSTPVRKYYVITDANRGAEGFSQTWYPHIWRVKLSPISDSQEYYDILGNVNDTESLKNDLSVYKSEFNISDAIVGSASQEDPDGTMLTDHLYDFNHATAGGVVVDNSNWNYGETIPSGTEFPDNPRQGDYFIRTDFEPSRLFVRNGSVWQRRYDNINDKTWSDRTYNASTYIKNEDNITVIDDKEFSEKQPLSDVITPLADIRIPTTESDGYGSAGYVQLGYVKK